MAWLRALRASGSLPTARSRSLRMSKVVPLAPEDGAALAEMAGQRGLLVANKTGGVSGTSNDAAIVYTPQGAPIVIVVYCKGLDAEQTQRAPQAIAAAMEAVSSGEPKTITTADG